MDAYESALLNALNDQVTILRKIILDNRLHESTCPAFSNHKGDFANLFQGIGEKYCDCWISRNNPETDPNKGYGIYERATEILEQEFFASRAEAVDFLTDEYNFSRNKDAGNYWQKSYYVLEITKQQAAPPPSRFSIYPINESAPSWRSPKEFSSRNEAIAALTAPETRYVENPMADLYWGHYYAIREIKEN